MVVVRRLFSRLFEQGGSSKTGLQYLGCLKELRSVQGGKLASGAGGKKKRKFP
jgi:hypothetical protein